MLRCYNYSLFSIYTIYRSVPDTLFFIQYYAVREFFKVFVIFYTEYVFLTGQLSALITAVLVYLYSVHAVCNRTECVPLIVTLFTGAHWALNYFELMGV
jgi:hypothetical protein